MKNRHRLGVALAVAAVVAVCAGSAPAKGFSTKLPGRAKAALARADRALVEGRAEAAARELERVAALAPDYADAYALYAHALAARPDARRAAAERYRAHAAARPDRAALWYAYGALAEEPAARKEAFSRAAALAPKAPWGHLGLADVAREAGDYETAVPLYERAYALDRRSVAVQLALASAYAGVRGRMGDALALATKIMAAAPGSYYGERAFDAVVNHVSRDDVPPLVALYVDRFPEGRRVVHAYTYRARAAARRDSATGGVEARAAWAALDRLRGPLFATDRGAFFREFLLPEAVAAGRVALDALAAERLASTEDSPDVFLALGQAYGVEPVDDAAAIRLLSRASELFAKLPGAPGGLGDDLHFELARAYARSGDLARAAEQYALVRADGELGPRAAAEAGAAFARLGEAQNAFAFYARAVALKPDPGYVAALEEAARAAGRGRAETDAAVWAVRDARARPAAGFTLDGLDGRRVSLEDYRGRVVLLTFWFPGCAPCRAEFPHLQALYEKYCDRGLDVVGIDITSDTAGSRAFLTRLGITFPSLLGDREGGVKSSYGVTGAPTNVLVDREGRVLFWQRGFHGEPGVRLLEAQIEAMLARPAAGRSA